MLRMGMMRGGARELSGGQVSEGGVSQFTELRNYLEGDEVPLKGFQGNVLYQICL